MVAFVSNFESTNGSTDIYISTENGSDLRRIAHTPFSSERHPTWSADGSRMAAFYTDDVHAGIFVFGADGNAPEFVTIGQDPAWLPSGDGLVCMIWEDPTTFFNAAIWTVGLDGTPLVNLSNHPAFARSPDGERLLFVASRLAGDDSSNASSIYVLDVDTEEMRLVIGQPDTGPVPDLVYLDPVFVPGSVAGTVAPTGVQPISWARIKASLR